MLVKKGEEGGVKAYFSASMTLKNYHIYKWRKKLRSNYSDTEINLPSVKDQIIKEVRLG